MNPICIQADQVAPQPWRNGGGQTHELLVWPSAEDWQLRISRADIDASGPFSPFAGVQRWFVVLSGNGVVLHMPTQDRHTLDHTLLPGHAPLHFDGSLAPGCTLINGPTQDLNLMARGGTACVLPVQSGVEWASHHAMCGLYTSVQGLWRCGTLVQALPAQTLLWMEQAPAQAMHWNPGPTARPAPAHPASPHLSYAPLSTHAWWLGYTPEVTP